MTEAARRRPAHPMRDQLLLRSNSPRTFGLLSWNRLNEATSVVFRAVVTGAADACLGFAGTGVVGVLHSAATTGETAMRRSVSLNKELNVGPDCAAAAGTGAADPVVADAAASANTRVNPAVSMTGRFGIAAGGVGCATALASVVPDPLLATA
jgi:hypothetical protein